MEIPNSLNLAGSITYANNTLYIYRTSIQSPTELSVIEDRRYPNDGSYYLTEFSGQNFYVYGPIENDSAPLIMLGPDDTQYNAENNKTYILFIPPTDPVDPVDPTTSPYATGGQILKINGTTYAHVFIRTERNGGEDEFSVTSGSLNASILCIGGGGGGRQDENSEGGCGGGGAGAYGIIVNEVLESRINDSNVKYNIIIGSGGAAGLSGEPSYIENNLYTSLIWSTGGCSDDSISQQNVNQVSATTNTPIERIFVGGGAGANYSMGDSFGGGGGRLFLNISRTIDGGDSTIILNGKQGPGAGGGGAGGRGQDNDQGESVGGFGLNPILAGISNGVRGEFNTFSGVFSPPAEYFCTGGSGGGVTDQDPSFSPGEHPTGSGSGGSSTERGGDGTTSGSGGGGAGYITATSLVNPLGAGAGADGLIIIYYNTNPICFPAGTQVETDQGCIAIDQIRPGYNTIGGKRIVAITNTRGDSKCLVKVSKSAISENVPDRDTLMTRWHKVYHGNRLRESWRLPNTRRHPYNGELLYNVLMETYQTMRVNNMTVETLHPNNQIARSYFNKN